MATPDPELTKAFSELQVKMIENSQRVKIAEGQVMAIKKDIAKSNLTDKELSNLPPGTNTYQAVGRMFMLQPVKKVRADLKKGRSDKEEKIRAIQNQVSYWEKEVRSGEESLRDLVSQKR
ncbi:prefoldin subunit 1-like isoform X2 [Halichondria panicea]|uniref:prefoldin subunit 1-like isoform X1 n=1 Tax=Halichondria panicea TaxID=6063 RepID=UPI00312B975C